MSSKTRSAQDWELREWEEDFSVPDDVTWKRMVIHDLCGGKSVPDDGNGTVILNQLLLDLYHYLNTPALVKHLVNKCLLTEGERWALTEKRLSPQEKTLHLQQILMKKGDNPLIEFYQCLLESYGLEPGLAGHYTLVQIIKRKDTTEQTGATSSRETDHHEPSDTQTWQEIRKLRPFIKQAKLTDKVLGQGTYGSVIEVEVKGKIYAGKS